MPQAFDLAWPSPAQQRAWRLPPVVMTQLDSDLNRELQANSRLSFQDFDILVRLQESDGHRLRPDVLADPTARKRSRTMHDRTDNP